MGWKERLRRLRTGELAAVDAMFDEAEPVRWQAAGMPGLSVRHLQMLADDESCAVRCRLAERTGLPETLIDRLAWDPEPQVRAAIAARPDLPAAARSRLEEDTDWRVQAALGDWEIALMLKDMPQAEKDAGKPGLLAGWRRLRR